MKFTYNPNQTYDFRPDYQIKQANHFWRRRHIILCAKLFGIGVLISGALMALAQVAR